MKLKLRIIFLLIFLGCTSLIGYAIYLQLAAQLLPCPLCVAQRVVYWLVGLTALFAFLHNTRGVGYKIYSILIAFFALLGMSVALRHSWLIRYPEAIECGISPEEEFLNNLLIAKWWPTMFKANGDCTDITWEFMSLTIPEWSASFFLLFLIIAIYVLLYGRAHY